MSLEDWNLGFSHPCTIQISGPIGCCKTRFVRQVLANRLIEPFPTRLIWVYGEWPEDYEALRALYPHIEFVHGWRESLYDSIRFDESNLLVLDDQMREASDSKQLARLFTKGLRYRNLSIIYLVQNVYDKGKSSRTVSLNAHYHVVFRNRRDASQFPVFASHMAPHRSGWLLDTFQDATRQPFGYMQIDNYPQTSDEQRIRTRILPSEQAWFYSERKSDGEDSPSPPAEQHPSDLSPHHAPTKSRRPLQEHACHEYKSSASHLAGLMRVLLVKFDLDKEE